MKDVTEESGGGGAIEAAAAAAPRDPPSEINQTVGNAPNSIVDGARKGIVNATLKRINKGKTDDVGGEEETESEEVRTQGGERDANHTDAESEQQEGKLVPPPRLSGQIPTAAEARLILANLSGQNTGTGIR